MNFIYKTIPRHTEEEVAIDKELRIYFMIDMDTNTIKPESVILFNLTEQKTEEVTFTYERRILIIQSVSNLLPNNHYQLQIIGGKKGVKDITGRGMPQTYELEFYTKKVESVKPPIILTPTDSTVVQDRIAIELEPKLDVDYYEVQISKSNTFQNLVWPTNGEKVYRTSEVEFTPDIQYETGRYHLRIRSVDFDGNRSHWSPTIRIFYDGEPYYEEMPEEPFPDSGEEDTSDPTEPEEPADNNEVVLITNSRGEFNDQLSALQEEFAQDDIISQASLYVTATTPKDKSVHHPLEQIRQIRISFSESIDPNTVTSNTCYLLAERN